MIVHCISFGSLWWTRRGCDEEGYEARAKTVFFNTTGFVLPNKTYRAYHLPGIVRINGKIHPYISSIEDVAGRMFRSTDIHLYGGSNRLLFLDWAPVNSVPDAFLVCIKSEEEGHIDFNSRWRRGTVKQLSRSYRNPKKRHKVGLQETLLLMGRDASVRTNLGDWRVECQDNSKPFLKLQ